MQVPFLPEPFPNLPGMQGLHDALPAIDCENPVGQALHVVFVPVVSANLPDKQLLQFVAFIVYNCRFPGAHGKHNVEPEDA